MDHRRKFACWSNPANRPDEGRLQFAAENIRDHAWTGEHLRLRKSQEIGKTYPRAILLGPSVKEDRMHRHWTKMDKEIKSGLLNLHDAFPNAALTERENGPLPSILILRNSTFPTTADSNFC